MPKYIGLEEAIDLFYSIDPENDGSDGCTVALISDDYTSEEIEEMLSLLPVADVAPVVHGRWLFGELDVLGASVKCSNCGWSVERVDPIRWIQYKGHQFCGCCGAQMDLEED